MLIKNDDKIKRKRKEVYDIIKVFFEEDFSRSNGEEREEKEEKERVRVLFLKFYS